MCVKYLSQAMHDERQSGVCSSFAFRTSVESGEHNPCHVRDTTACDMLDVQITLWDHRKARGRARTYSKVCGCDTLQRLVE